MFELKTLSREAVPRALAKAEPARFKQAFRSRSPVFFPARRVTLAIREPFMIPETDVS